MNYERSRSRTSRLGALLGAGALALLGVAAAAAERQLAQQRLRLPEDTVQGAPVKTVDDAGAYGLGSTVNWSVAATVPNQQSGDPLTRFGIADLLDSRLTPPTSADVSVSLASSTGTAIALPAADYAVTVSGQTVTHLQRDLRSSHHQLPRRLPAQRAPREEGREEGDDAEQPSSGRERAKRWNHPASPQDGSGAGRPSRCGPASSRRCIRAPRHHPKAPIA
jgi:fimbrial isopeptide formation D2 family protein